MIITLKKRCSFCLPCVVFVEFCQLYILLSRLALIAGCEIGLY